MGYTIQSEIVVSDEMIETIIEMGGYGIAYWAWSLDVDYTTRSVHITDGYETDPSTGELRVFVATFEEIAQALAVVASSKSPVAYWLSEYAMAALQQDDPGHIDSQLADVVLQLAAIGEVIYG